MSEYCIASGEFQKMCSTTRETLRYYERHGILVPWKDPENGYRYYSRSQITSYYFIKAFRDMGCPVEEIRSYLLSGEDARFDGFVEDQYNALLEQKRLLEERIATVANTRALLSYVRKAAPGIPVLTRLPGSLAVMVTPVTSSRPRSASEMTSDIPRHLLACRERGALSFPLGACIDRLDLLMGDYAYKCLFSFAQPSSADQDLLDLGESRVAGLVISEEDGDIRAHYTALVEFCREKKLRLKSDLFSLSLVNVVDPNAERRYLKYLFIVVEEEPAASSAP